MVKSMDIRIQGTAQVTDRLGVGSALNDLQDFNLNDTSLANQAKCPTHIGTEGTAVRASTMSPDRSLYVLYGSKLQLLFTQTGEVENFPESGCYDRGAKIGWMAVSPDNQWLVVTYFDQSISLWHIPTRSLSPSLIDSPPRPPRQDALERTWRKGKGDSFKVSVKSGSRHNDPTSSMTPSLLLGEGERPRRMLAGFWLSRAHGCFQ